MSAAPVKILVIDGEAPIRRLLRMGFSTQGYEIIDAPNGRAAIELLVQKPDLITLDLNLPDIPGFELLKVIRMRAETIPIAERPQYVLTEGGAGYRLRAPAPIARETHTYA